MKKNRISKNWINKQKRDIYVRQSQVDGYRARSAYKLIEIDEKFKIFKNGISVIDLGASPGSWSQYIARTVKSGRLVSIDLKNMEAIENIIQKYTSVKKKVKLTHLSPECKVLLLKANPSIANSIEQSIDDPRYYVVTDLIDREV